MSESICRFIPVKNGCEDMRTVHFVYETENETLSQPFVHSIYYLHLVTNGTALLKMAEKEYRLGVGDLFFSFAGCPFETAETKDFKYLYISFMGKSVLSLLERLGVSINAPVYAGFNHLAELWFSAIARANEDNVGLLSDGVLRYTLSFLTARETVAEDGSLSELLIDYVKNNFTDPDLSLTRVASLFSYTEKYVSRIFKREAGIGFSQYVSELRLSHASVLIGGGETSVACIAHACGYKDALYFSKVFKKKHGHTPSEAIKRKTEQMKGSLCL